MSRATRIETAIKAAATLAPAVAIALVLATAGDGAPSAATAAGAKGARLPAVPTNGEMGFVITQFHTAIYNGDPKVDCPDGMLGVLKDDYLRTQTPAEQARLLLKENMPELQKKWQEYGSGPNGTNVCSNINEFMDRPPTRMNKGRIAEGFNLDNDESGAGNDSYTCSHDNYASPAGEKGIDHQFWRVQGCSDMYRGTNDNGAGEVRKAYDDMMMTGQMTQVLLLKGVNSLVNDPDLTVIYANTDDRPTIDSRGKPIFKASYSISTLGKKVEYHNVLHGRIVDGVLTTDTRDILLNGFGAGSEFDFARGRIRMTFQPDGTAKGMVGGYMPILSNLQFARAGGAGSVRVAGINCAGQFTALRMMADGDKDPKTGKCRKISNAFEFLAIPGFVNDVQSGRMAAK